MTTCFLPFCSPTCQIWDLSHQSHNCGLVLVFVFCLVGRRGPGAEARPPTEECVRPSEVSTTDGPSQDPGSGGFISVPAQVRLRNGTQTWRTAAAALCCRLGRNKKQGSSAGSGWGGLKGFNVCSKQCLLLCEGQRGEGFRKYTAPLIHILMEENSSFGLFVFKMLC